MPFPKSIINFSGGCICYLESKSDVQISFDRRFRIAERIDYEVSVCLKLSCKNNTDNSPIFENRFRSQQKLLAT